MKLADDAGNSPLSIFEPEGLKRYNLAPSQTLRSFQTDKTLVKS